MKRIIYSLVLTGMMLFASCDDNVLDIDEAPYLEVTTEKTTYKAGEEVIFNIEGNPRLLNFWSGEVYNDYEYRAGRIVSTGRGTLFSFEMMYQYATRTGGTIRVLASTDFEGDRSSFDDVDAATWTDITDQCNIDYESEQYAFSGEVDVSYLMEEDKPIYFAFKYDFDPALGSTGAIVWIRDVRVEVVTGIGPFELTQGLFTDFLPYAAGSIHKNPIKSDNRETSLVMWPNSGTPTTVDDIVYDTQNPTQEYFVTRPYYVYEPLDIGPDKPVSLKHYAEARVPSHVHVFYNPGVYRVRFVGVDHSIRGQKETIKELEITVLPTEED